MQQVDKNGQIDIENNDVKRMVVQASYKIKGLPMEHSDIQQELYLALLIYFEDTPIEDRTLGAVRVIISRKLYRLIRLHTKFEGCCEETRKVRRNISTPISLDQFRHSSESDCQHGSQTCSLYLQDKSEGIDGQLIADQLLTRACSTMSEREIMIIEAMLDGHDTPRAICAVLNFNTDTATRKKVSKEISDIRTKFRKVLSNA